MDDIRVWCNLLKNSSMTAKQIFENSATTASLTNCFDAQAQSKVCLATFEPAKALSKAMASKAADTSLVSDTWLSSSNRRAGVAYSACSAMCLLEKFV